ncbi:ArdC-like ssDNA-binding domain-containing protein [uncultured Parabacteroides sp.]|uniref:ArdC-like ssDNA-binding domain-containing protein n=1 Tax=uncultured Parabacteroides sp. TaxID=512312 RepID=UPI00272A4404|nr:ArdC-like ssDNA-binding domain-containing protein [uncultured Parabacteroides sp.]
MPEVAKAVSPVVPLVVTGTTQREKIKCITEKLEEGVRAVFTSHEYREYLNFLSKFHDYSYNNVILIKMQLPSASLVAGYGDWLKKHHRYVRKGEKAIRILAPTPYKKKKEMDVIDEHGNKSKEEVEVLVPCFKIVNVFDVSQTEGEPLPSLGVDELDGTVEQFDTFMDALVAASPAPIGFENIPGSAHGYYDHVERRIAIQEGMPQLQTVKTGVHEVAHAILHAWPEGGKKPKDGPDRHTKEVQAESVAYTVCQHYGLETSDYSFAYIAGWSSGRDVKELKESLCVIRQTAHDLIAAIDAALGVA